MARVTHRPLSTLLCVVLLAPRLVAQDAPAARPCSFDTAAHTDTVVVVYSLMPELVSSHHADDVMAYSFYAQTIGQHFSAPKAMTLAYLATSPGVPASPTMNDLGLGGDLSFTVDSTGRLQPPVTATTSATELNDALVLAVAEADSQGELSPPPRNAEFPGGRVRLRIHASEVAPAGAVPLLRARVQSLRIDSPPQVLSMPDPKYPEPAQNARTASRVVLRYVIDETGMVLPSSLQVVEATYREFVTSAADALLKARFTAARTAGCPVPMLVQQAVGFKP